MAALPIPKYGLDKLYLFPYYQTRDQYMKAIGEEPPPFDATRPPKYWFDPNLLNSAKRSVVYENTLAVGENGRPASGPDGRPFLEPLLIFRLEAATVNIPLKQTANEPGAEVPEVPPPVRALDPDEELVFDFGGLVLVRNTKLIEDIVVGFTLQDREILHAVARKLNVNL